MRSRWFFLALTVCVLAGAGVSAWMLVPLSHLPLASLTDAQADRVIWGWALATLALGLGCLWLVLVVHGWVRRAERRARVRGA